MSEVTTATFTTWTIVFLTPDTDGSEWRLSFARHATNFDVLDVIVLSMLWSTAPFLNEPAYIYLGNLAQDHHRSAGRWTKWLQSWLEQIGLIDSPDLLLWNTKKTSLAHLETEGLPIIATSYVECADRSTMVQAAAHFNMPLHTDEHRVQKKYGDKCLALDGVLPEIRTLVNAILSACPEMPLSARIDILQHAAIGGLCAIELELIEPGFFLYYTPDGDMLFATTVLSTIR